MDGRRGEERVGEVPRENEIGGCVPRGQFSHFGLFFSSLVPHAAAFLYSLSDTRFLQSVYEPFPNLIHYRAEETKEKGNLYSKNISRRGKFLGLAMCSAISLYFMFREK
jgi:hypothetical protein